MVLSPLRSRPCVRIGLSTSDADCLKLARWVTAIVGLVGTAMAVVLAKADVRSLWETFIAVIGLFGGTISGLFLLGMKRSILLLAPCGWPRSLLPWLMCWHH